MLWSERLPATKIWANFFKKDFPFLAPVDLMEDVMLPSPAATQEEEGILLLLATLAVAGALTIFRFTLMIRVSDVWYLMHVTQWLAASRGSGLNLLTVTSLLLPHNLVRYTVLNWKLPLGVWEFRETSLKANMSLPLACFFGKALIIQLVRSHSPFSLITGTQNLLEQIEGSFSEQPIQLLQFSMVQ